MTTDELFAAFGGRDVVMAVTGAGRNAANNWRHDGVPYRHWKALLEAAQARGIPSVTLETLEMTRRCKAAA